MSEYWNSWPVTDLPPVYRDYVTQAAESIGCDASYLALPLLSVVAAAIGNSRRIELKPDWSEPAIVWAVIVGESGTMKSPALSAALHPTEWIEGLEFRKFREVSEQGKSAQKEYEHKLRQWKKENGDFSTRPIEPEKPRQRRFLFDDATIEAVADLLEENPRGLLLASDELSTWFASFGLYRSGRGNDAAKWCSIFNAKPIRVDRKTAEKRTIYVERPNVSICGSIQPEILRAVLSQKFFDNGLAARLLFAQPPYRVSQWSEATIDPTIRANLTEAILRLYGLQMVGETPGCVTLDPEAKQLWVDFDNRIKEEMGSADEIGRRMLAKMEAYTARFALLHHLMRWSVGEACEREIDGQSVKHAANIAQWFKEESFRVYNQLHESDEEETKRQVNDFVKRKGRVQARDLLSGVRRFRGQKVEEAERFLRSLMPERGKSGVRQRLDTDAKPYFEWVEA